jgi:hypothetical protein
MLYQVRSGDSPAKIARRFGVPLNALVNANRHKPTTNVNGVHTWRSLRAGEAVHVPAGGFIGFVGVTPAAPGAPHGQIRKGSSGPDVALWQSIIGVTADGIFGSGTDAATRTWQTQNGLTADGIVGPNTWSKALGAGTTVTQSAPSAPSTSSIGVAAAATAAVAALLADPNYCSSVSRSGTPVNTAVHNFKNAWNSANPGNTVPINTGNYEPSVAAALSSALGGIPVPPGCGAGGSPPAPAALPSLPSMPSIPSITPVTTGAIPAAIQALASANPCAQSSAPLVCAAQAALGLSPDGKYGNDTATALRRFIPNAPAGCSPAPLWWGKKTDNQCGGAAAMPSLPSIAPAPSPVITSPGLPSLPSMPSMPTSMPSLPSMPTQAPSVSVTVPGSTTTVGPTQPAVTAPTDKKISTGALVAGGIGAAALVGLVAVAASGKKTSTSRTTTVRRSSPHKAHKKSKRR